MNNFYRFLRCAVMLAVMIFGGGIAAWGQTEGLYYIDNNKGHSGATSGRYYLVPADDPQKPDKHDAFYSSDYSSQNGDPEKPFLTVYKTNKDKAEVPAGVVNNLPNNSVWILKAVSGESEYFYIIHASSGKYVIYEPPHFSRPNRKSMHLLTTDSPGENAKFEVITNGSGYNIRPKSVTSDKKYFNPAGSAWDQYYGNEGNDSPAYDYIGLIGLWNNASDKSVWYTESTILAAPTITYESTSNTTTITITDVNGMLEGYTILYTTDGTDPTTSSTVTEYSEPFNVTSNCTVNAVVVRYGIVLTEVANAFVSAIAAPEVTNNFDGNISLSTTTTDATIYYTTNGDTPDNTSTKYTSAFSLGDATIIKAIAYKGSDFSAVTTYNVPTYTKPTISFDISTSKITISSEGTVYYNTGDGSQAAPTPASGTLYSEPFTVSPPTTVKAIATHAGYLNSEVATKYIKSNDYSQDYLTFTVLTPGTIKWKAIGSGAEKTIEYKLNTGSWTSITSTSAGVDITVVAGDEVRFRGSNTTYCESNKNNYSGFEGGTATFNIEGNIMSLTAGDNFDNITNLPSKWAFCSLFKKSLVISAENLILPATSLKDYCYRSMFSKCTTLEVAPALPAATLATCCYYYMFEDCAITTAPELLATTLVKECYGYMFKGCANLNYIKCFATTGFNTSNCLSNWVNGVSPIGTFMKENVTYWSTGISGIPFGWNAYITALVEPIITCDGEFITITCETYGASIYYRLGQTGSYSLYSTPFAIHENTVVEAYAVKGELHSNTVSENCIAIKSYRFAGMKITPGPLYYGSNGYEIQEDWNHDSYNTVYGKTVGSTYFNFIELGQLFESSVFSKSDGNIENILDPLEEWRVPTNTEWASILGTTRSGSTVNGTPDMHYAMIELTGVTHAGSSTPSGLLIFPDGETITGAALSNMDNTTSNTGITESQLNEYLHQGCLFLPGSGCYNSSQQTWNNEHYYYWSSIENDLSTGYVSSGDDKDKETCYFPVYLVKNDADEATRLLRTWTYNGNEVEVPYSINAIDGHSSNYARNTFTFSTDVKVKESQPTYLWFQHADQSADIYVNNVKVTTHWGGYTSFFVDITGFVHAGDNNIKVALCNTKRNTLAPYTGDFNMNATLGEVKLISSPVVPSPDYGYDGFHITSTVTAASATITVKTKVPTGATLTCSIKGENCNYSNTQTSTGDEITFTTTITNPHLWNGTLNPYLYDVTLTIEKEGVVYHTFKRGYGLRFYEYVINQTVGDNENYTGFLLNGSPCLLRGVCMHSDLEGKANALTAEDIDNDFEILKELGCNFVRLAHYPHPKEVYDRCDRLGIVVQTEAPCVNDFYFNTTLDPDYYNHLYIQYEDMVRQHFNHPCIMFWGLGNEIKTDNKSAAKTQLEAYRTFIRGIDSERWVGYVVDHKKSNPSSEFNNPNMDWFGCNIYVGWYINNGTDGELTNDPSGQLDTRIGNIITNKNKPLAFSEYGCGGTRTCHSDDYTTTTDRGNKPRHDIEYQMWLHEGHIAAIKDKPELLFTSQWQLFDIAVTSRTEGYKVSLDGETVYDNYELQRLNNKGLVERDHKTKKDTYYLYKAWWNQDDKFVHICGKDYEKLTDRVIKCYTNDGSTLTLFVNNEEIQTVTVTNNIATFTARNFNPGDVIRVNGATSNDTFTFTNYSEDYVFTTKGNWNNAANWSPAVPTAARNVTIDAACTIPAQYTAKANDITIGGGSLTIADGGQLVLNPADDDVTATFKKNIEAWNNDDTRGWYTIASPIGKVATSSVTNLMSNSSNQLYNLYRYDEPTALWIGNAGFDKLDKGAGYLYRNNDGRDLSFTGIVNVSNATDIELSYTASVPEGVRGFHLIGNPFSENITISNITGADISGVYVLSNAGAWGATVTEIKPCEGFLVQVNEKKTISINKPVNAKGIKYNKEYIQFIVANNQYEDVTFAMFDNGNGLNKINHRNSEIPMIYIPQNNQDYAIAMMRDDTKSFNLKFKAMTTGKYTLSYKATGEYNYLHVFDRLTGIDVDMLLDGEYSFIGTPNDNENRFIVNLEYMPNYSEGDTDIFAYQNGNEILVSGEGELQIFDVMGRLVMTTTISGAESINLSTQGVYILRLVGTDIKTQKIVVR